MNLDVLFFLLLAHFIADFLIQTEKVVTLKSSSDWKLCLKGNAIHAGIYLLVLTISVVYYWSTVMFCIVIIISLFHFLIDFIKSSAILRKPFRRYSINIFLIDQVCHLLVIYFSLFLINMNPSVSMPMKMMIERVISSFNSSADNLTYNQRLILFLILFVIGLWGIGIFIRLFFKGMTLKPYEKALNLKMDLSVLETKNDTNNGGYIIGILERLIVVISILTNVPLLIGFALAAKSVARTKLFEDSSFGEQYIIGTFISFISAIIIGYICKALNIFPY